MNHASNEANPTAFTAQVDAAREKYAAEGSSKIEPGLALARLLLSAKQFAEAESLLRQLLKHWPGKQMARRLHARALLGLGEEDQAVAALDDIYTDAVELAIRRLCSPQIGGGPAIPPWLLKLILQREFRVLNSEDARQFISSRSSAGATPPGQGKDWFFYLKNGSLQGPPVADLSMRMLDACLMLQQGQPRVFNPLTGSLSEQVQSVLPELVVLRDGGQSVWVSCVPKLFASTTLESVYLLPEERLIIDTRGRDDATALGLLLPDLLHYLSRHDEFCEVLDRRFSCSGITVADRPLAHLGHYIWNGISTWSTLLASGLFPQADYLASWSTADYFGELCELYPEFEQAGARTLRVNKIDDALEHIERTGNFWLPMYERYVREDLAQRIAHSCADRANQEFLEDLQALRQPGAPLVLLTLRLGNRVWVEQEAGFASIIDELSRRFPGIAFILDGMTTTGSTEKSTHQHMDINGEMELAQSIMRRADPGARIINAIGIPLTDSITACREIDAFIAPWGTGMAKYKWIANKPGVAFGNRLPEGKEHQGIGIRVFDKFRENGIKAVDIPRKHIRDAGEGNLDHPLRRNLELSWEVLAEAISSLLLEQGFASTQAGS